jgi:hypothetical protein
MKVRNFLIIASAFPYGTYSILYLWSYFSGLERIGESTQGYFLLASVHVIMILSGMGWSIIIYKVFRRSYHPNATHFFLIFATFNSLAWLTWLTFGIALEEMPFRHNLQRNQSSTQAKFSQYYTSCGQQKAPEIRGFEPSSIFHDQITGPSIIPTRSSPAASPKCHTRRG